MKTFATISLLALTASGSVIKRQGHSHDNAGGTYGGFPGAGAGGKGFDLGAIMKQMPKGGLMSMLNPSVRKAYKIEEIKPLRNPEAKRIRITYGPYKIKAANAEETPGNGFSMDKAGTGYMNKMDDDFPRDITIIDTVTRVLNETFEKATVEDGLYNHHVVFFDVSKPPPQKWVACANKQPTMPEVPMAIIMGAGSEDPDRDWVESKTKSNAVKSGFYIGKNDKVQNMVDIVNYQERERTIYTVSEMEFFPGKPEGFVHAQNKILPMGMCDGLGALAANNIHPEVGKTKFVLSGKNEIEVIKDGYIVGTYGHLHDGGLKMVLTINGKDACTSSIVYGGPGHEQVQKDGTVWKTIGKTIGCVDPIRVSKGDKLNMFAHFNFDEHPPRQSAHGEEAESMALVGTTFVPLNGE